MAQQTAVEWLQTEWQKKDIDISIRELWQQAKAMEKEQIIQSSRISYLAGQEYYTLNGLSKQFAEQYYNETYNK